MHRQSPIPCYTLKSFALETNPHPVFPACVCAPRPEQIPEGPAQHVLPQSAPERHCPPMNCPPLPLPTFFVPAGSKAGPPALALEGGFATAVDEDTGAASAASDALLETNPHPVFPAWVCAPRPEQMPEGPAQQVLAQSAPERHWPPMN